jgi:hypothetical protein
MSKDNQKYVKPLPKVWQHLFSTISETPTVIAPASPIPFQVRRKKGVERAAKSMSTTS